MNRLIDIILAAIILIGAAHVGAEVVAWINRTNSPLGRVAIVIGEGR